jgi:hypothetical protein
MVLEKDMVFFITQMDAKYEGYWKDNMKQGFRILYKLKW